jgi:hypothetical protein
MADLHKLTNDQLRLVGGKLGIALKGKKDEMVTELEKSGVAKDKLDQLAKEVQESKTSTTASTQNKPTSGRAPGKKSSHPAKSGKKAAPALTGDAKFNESLLFTYLSLRKNPTYNSILNFFSSFDVATEPVLQAIIKKLKDGDIVYKGVTDPKYKAILERLIFSPKFRYPKTMTMREAFQEFQGLGYSYANEFRDLVEKIARAHPSFVALSSSEIGADSDLLTFKQIFDDNITFESKKNWVL